MDVFTIGFTKKSAETFFGLLKTNGIERLVDVRLNNVSQLAGFTKRNDLSIFVRALCTADYVHEPLLAPDQEMLDAYKKRKGGWGDYEKRFLALMESRKIEHRLDRSLFGKRSVFLCSEPTADHCHRRLVAEYLQTKWKGLQITHL